MDPRERLIVALDVPSLDAAQAMVARLGSAVSFYKIGYQLAFSGGLDYASELTQSGKRVFLDLKLHDIGNTVTAGVKSVAGLGASFLTVHAFPQVMHRYIRTTNAIESLFSNVRQRTDQIDTFTTETSCLTIVWAVMQDIRLPKIPVG